MALSHFECWPTHLEFKQRFENKYLSLEYKARKMDEFISLKQGKMSVAEYDQNSLTYSAIVLPLPPIPLRFTISLRREPARDFVPLAAFA